MNDYFEKKYGKGVIVPATDPSVFDEAKDIISTGSLTLDKALGVGGIPLNGKAIALIGLEGTGKSTLMYSIIANTQKQGKKVVIIDTEGSIDHAYMHTIGIDMNELLVVNDRLLLKGLGIKDRPIASAEEYCDLISDLIASGDYGLICLDSANQLVPKAEIDNGMGNAMLGRQAAVFSKAGRIWRASLKANQTTSLLYIGQYRFNPNAYIPLQESLGQALKYLQDIKIELTKKVDKDINGAYGLEVVAKVTKNKCAPPLKKGSYYIEFSKGIVPEFEIFNLAVEQGYIKKAGSWMSLYNNLEQEGDPLIKLQGEDKMIEHLHSNPEFTEELIKKLVI